MDLCVAPVESRILLPYDNPYADWALVGNKGIYYRGITGLTCVCAPRSHPPPHGIPLMLQKCQQSQGWDGVCRGRHPRNCHRF